MLLRRDALQADDGFNYSTLTIWKDEASFNKWREGSSKRMLKADQSEAIVRDAAKSYTEGVLALLDPQGA